VACQRSLPGVDSRETAPREVELKVGQIGAAGTPVASRQGRLTGAVC